MKNIYNKITLTLLVFCWGSMASLHAQCPNDNVMFGSDNAGGWAVNAWNSLTTCIYGGEYRLITGLTPGVTYEFQTCGNTAFNTVITVRNEVGGAVITSNDNFCGLQSFVSFAAPASGQVRVLVDQSPCASNSTCMTLQGRRVGVVPPPGAGSTCAAAVVVGGLPYSNAATTCGAGNEYTSGTSCTGLYLGGQDYVYTYTHTGPNASINYTLNNTDFSGWIGFHVTTACLPGGTCVHSNSSGLASSLTGNFAVTTGTTYLIFIDSWPAPDCYNFNVNLSLAAPLQPILM